MKGSIVVGSDIEYTLALRDFAFEVLARILGEQGKRVYAALSSFDDVLGLFPDVLEDEELKELARDYVPGTTPLLIMPFLAAFCEFNDGIVEDLAAITDLRINRGVPELIYGLQQNGVHIALISSSCDAFARRSATVLNLPYWYASIFHKQGNFSEEAKRGLRELAMETAACRPVEFKGDAILRTDSNFAAVRALERIFKKLAAYVDLHNIARSAMGGMRKVKALEHAVQYASGQFGRAMEDSWMTRVMYLGDSITDEVVLREVANGGGLSVAVNGNAFALAHADVTVISKNLGCIGELAALFASLGKAKLAEEISRRQDEFAEMGIFLNDRTPALRVLSNNMRVALKGEKAVIN